MRKMLKVAGIVILILVMLLIVWTKMPVSITYYKEIKMGNLYAKNIAEYKKLNGKLPKEGDWETLVKLDPLKHDENYPGLKPEYRIIDSSNFSLTYVEGFDPPYLTYDTKSKKWEMRFN